MSVTLSGKALVLAPSPHLKMLVKSSTNSFANAMELFASKLLKLLPPNGGFIYLYFSFISMNFKSLAIAALISFGALAPVAEARPSRIYCDRLPDGTHYCVKPIGSDSIQLVFHNYITRTGFTAFANCETGYVGVKDEIGYTDQGVIGFVDIACDF